MTETMSKFNERLARINDPKNISNLDPETGINIPRRLSIGQIKEHNFGVRQRKITLLVSFVLAMIAVVVARYVRFTFAEIPDVGTDPITLLFMDLGIAALITFVIGGMMKLKSLRHMNFQLAGIVFMMASMHNIIWMFPVEARAVFPPEYVNQVRSLTEPQSLYFVGKTFKP